MPIPDPNAIPIAPQWVAWALASDEVRVLAALVGFVLGALVAGVLSRVMTR